MLQSSRRRRCVQKGRTGTIHEAKIIDKANEGFFDLAAAMAAPFSTARDLEFAQQELERLQGQLEQLRSESVGKSSDHQRSVEQLTLDFQSRLESLEEQKSLEARQKHELALSLRSVEERSRSDLAQLEAQRDQLELQCTAMGLEPATSWPSLEMGHT
eukprot:s306_g9.t1